MSDTIAKAIITQSCNSWNKFPAILQGRLQELALDFQIENLNDPNLQSSRL